MPTIKNVTRPSIEIDREKLRRAGITVQTVIDAVQQQNVKDRSLEDAMLTSSSGAKVRLGDLVHIKSVQEPNYYIRHWPPVTP